MDMEIPDDLVWDANFPPVVFGCSGMQSEHLPACDGKCQMITMTEDDVKLTNEYRAWGRLKMPPIGFPANIPMLPGTEGVPIPMLELSVKVDALIKTLMEAFPQFSEQFGLNYKRTLLETLWAVRMNSEEQILAQRQEKIVGAVRSSSVLLGPNGERLL